MSDELFRQQVENLGVARRVVHPEVVHRINDPDPEVMSPHAIHSCLREVRVLLRDDPLGKVGPTVGCLLPVGFRTAEEAGFFVRLSVTTRLIAVQENLCY